MIDPERLYKTNEVASILRVSIVTVKRYIASGKIDSIKIGGIRRIRGREIKNIVESSDRQASRRPAV